MDELEKLWRSTGDAHNTIQTGYFTLLAIARSIEYLHPAMAADLRKVAYTIEAARETIQGNTAEEVNINIRSQERAAGEFLNVLLSRVQ